MLTPSNHILFTFILFAIRCSGLAQGEDENGYTTDQLTPFLEAEKVELLSLHPANYPSSDPFGPDGDREPVVTDHGRCHQNPILGKADLSSTKDLKQVQAAIVALHREALNWNGAVPLCFWPRHCLRVRTAKGTYELLICYECSRAQIFEQESLVGFIQFNSDNPRSSANPKILNRLFRMHGVTLPSPPNP